MRAEEINIERIGQANVLSHDEMVACFKQLEDGDASMRNKLIITNMRLVIAIAKTFKERSGTMLEDIIQEGTFGLIKAVERFDWRRGYKFSTYATWWIKQAIGQSILKKKRMIRLPAHAVTMQRYMASAAEQYKKKFGHAPTENELIDLVGEEKNIRVSKTVVTAMTHSCKTIVSLQAPALCGKSTGSDPKTYEHIIADESPSADPYDNVATHELVQITRRIFESLSMKEIAIIRLRFGLCDDGDGDDDRYSITENELDDIKHGKGLTDERH